MGNMKLEVRNIFFLIQETRLINSQTHPEKLPTATAN